MSALSETSQRDTPIATSAAPRFTTARHTGFFIAALTAGIASVMLIAYLVLALTWRERPFIGAMLTHTLVISGTTPVGGSFWSGLDAGLRPLDQIVGVNGQNLPQEAGYKANWQTFATIIESLNPGNSLNLQFYRAAPSEGVVPSTNRVMCDAPVDGRALCRVEFRVGRFPNTDFIAYFLIPFVSGVIMLAIGLTVLRLRPQQSSAHLLAVTCSLLAILVGGVFDNDTTHIFTPLWLVATVFLGSALATMALVFPVKQIELYNRPQLLYVPAIIGAILAAAVVVIDFNPPTPEFVLDNSNIAIMSPLVGLGMLTLALMRRRVHATSPIIRDQSNTVLIGIVLSVSPVFIWMLNTLGRAVFSAELIPFTIQAAMTFFMLTPISMAYAVLQQRSIETDRVISQGITYSIMLLALVIGYFLLVFGATLVTRQFVSATDIALMAVAIFVVALLFLPVRTRLQEKIDEVYFRTRRDYQNQIEDFAQKITHLVDFKDIMREFVAQLDASLKPTQIFIFLPSRETGDYIAFGDPKPETDIRFEASSSLVQMLRKSSQLIYLEPGRPWEPELLTERARLLILRALVIASMPGRQQLHGFICIGAPRSGKGSYDYETLRFVQSLVRQISVAVERAQVVESLERRVRELDVLSQISQAVNFTANYNDMLELISAQTDKLVEASHFYIVMRDSQANELYFAFFQEDGDRYPDRENKRWAFGRDLYSDILSRGQALNIADYAHRMTERGYPIVFEDSKLKAWMGVPLIAGLRTLGVMAAGTTQLNRSYTDDQLKIFTDIAALTATALDNARLFNETNVRARQLAALNDISRQLVAAELDLEKLLELITSNAVDILNAEAGSLLLTADDSSGDLEFKVAVGGSGQSVIGRRLAAGRGLVGEVAKTGQIVIVNDAANDPRWGGELSKGSFTTVSVLAVPLITQNRVIGVLELLNKKDDAPFDKDDADLLSTLSSQAAVAIENARLFQLTDFQLSARVKELEALERIDVELNRSLDLTRVAEITVQWAVTNTGATAGMLGIVAGDPPHLEVVAAQGYDSGALIGDDGASHLVLSDRGILSRVIRTRRADVTTDVTLDSAHMPLLSGATSQITVPMLSGGAVNALLILEKRGDPRLGLVELSSVQRLADHASIAIANAQLYAELTRANDSKSEFVSFVAHELKNPLTSIKGYSDLLLTGAVGGLSDHQKNFLEIVRFNADRMDTLVSDLNDVTKLEGNKLRIEPSSVDFRTVVTETLRPLQKQIEDKQQTLVIDVPPELPLIEADQNRMIQVMTNLVSNAHKYSPSGGRIIIEAALLMHRRDSKGQEAPPMLQVSVKDNGIGMSEEDLTRLFTPYFRSDNPLTRQQPGTGLGLTITRGIIQRHGGEVRVESELGQGTTFIFTVPLAEETQQVAK